MENIASIAARLRKETQKIIVGKQLQIDLILMSIFSGGHVLLSDLPGSGKTTLVRTLSIALGCDFRRLQFTPDLLPSDIVGMMIYNQKAGDFELKRGPVHTNILLADEINRAIPRTQAALLEAMEERQTTIDGVSLPLPDPFFVLATQNPVEHESTFMLPAAQMDRFFLRLSMGYPTQDEEVAILAHLGDRTPYEEVQTIANPEMLRVLRGEIAKVTVSDAVSSYIVQLVQKTRSHPQIKVGASPRASRTLYQGSKAWAAMQGRSFVIPEDIQTIFNPVMNHRITLTSDARLKKRASEDVLSEILEGTTIPPTQKELFGRHA
ncbi:MAG: MoxR family ATPase [Clostridia bacterium]|nr:MoxR family ATPase [Clostridia bacterium]